MNLKHFTARLLKWVLPYRIFSCTIFVDICLELEGSGDEEEDNMYVKDSDEEYKEYEVLISKKL